MQNPLGARGCPGLPVGVGGWTELCRARENPLQPGLLPALVPALTFLPASSLCRFMSARLEETLQLLSGLSTKAWEQAIP